MRALFTAVWRVLGPVVRWVTRHLLAPVWRVLGPVVRWVKRRSLRLVVLTYLGLLVCLPVGYLFYESFSKGWGSFWTAITSQPAVTALWLSARIALVVVIASTVAGVGGAMLIARYKFFGRRALDLVYDLPVAVSPVIIGVAFILAYARTGWLGPWLQRNGIMVIFSPTGIALATAAVTLPFMLRSIVPVLIELGDNEEQAARTLGASTARRFVTITLPAIRWAALYGIVLTLARALGEFGAVVIVAGFHQTLAVYTYAQIDPNNDEVGAFAAAVVLAAISIVALVVLSILRARERRRRVNQA